MINALISTVLAVAVIGIGLFVPMIPIEEEHRAKKWEQQGR
ncbi:MAG: hypothetical protein ACPHJV_06645 [Miltoncostaeaceae bacterium]